MEITSFSLSRLGLSSRIQFVQNFLGLLDSNDYTLLDIAAQYTALQQRWQEMSGIYITDSKNPLTQEINDLDLQRDDSILCIWLMAEAHSHSPIAAKKQAAEKILRNLSLYADSPSSFGRQKSEEESNNIANLLAGWTADTDLASARNLLGLTDVCTALTEINDQYNVKFLARTSMYATKIPDISKQKQAEMAAAYIEVCRNLNAMAVLTPSAAYDKTISEINALIAQAVLSLRQSAGHRKATTPEVS